MALATFSTVSQLQGRAEVLSTMRGALRQTHDAVDRALTLPTADALAVLVAEIDRLVDVSAREVTRLEADAALALVSNARAGHA